MLVYTRYKDIDGEVKDKWVDNFFDFAGIYFNPTVEELCTITLAVSGNTYKERKEDLRNKAIDYSNNWSDMHFYSIRVFQEFFEKNAKRYGLVREFKENAIC